MALCDFLTQTRFLPPLYMPANILGSPVDASLFPSQCFYSFHVSGFHVHMSKFYNFWLHSPCCEPLLKKDWISKANSSPSLLLLSLKHYVYTLDRLRDQIMLWAALMNTLDLGLWRISGITSDSHTVDCVRCCTIIHEKRPQFYLTWDMTHLVIYWFRGGVGGNLQGVGEEGLTASFPRLLNSRVSLVGGGSLAVGVNESHGHTSEVGHLLMPHNGRLWLQSGFKYWGTHQGTP